VEVGERHDFHRVVVRSWFVLLPLARARGRVDLIQQAYPRFAARKVLESDSHYARIVATAAHLHFAALGLEPAFVPGIEERLRSFELDHSGPSWLAAIETVFGSWLARLLLARGEVAAAASEAERALTLLESRAPWWRAKAIRALEQAGAATAPMLKEAATIENGLGI